MAEANPENKKIAPKLTVGVITALVLAVVFAFVSGRNSAEVIAGDELYTVDFTSADDWNGVQSDTPNTSFSLEPENGLFRVGANTENYAWALNTDTHTDILIESRPRLATDNPNNGYGVGCRVQQDGAGYWFLVSRDGYAAILIAGSNGSVINLSEWKFSNAVNTGATARNTLQAACDGETLVFTVNGEQIAQVTDTTYSSGTSALIASGASSRPTNVVFNRVRAWNVEIED